MVDMPFTCLSSAVLNKGDEHVDDVLLHIRVHVHTHVRTYNYRFFLILLISVGLT